MVMKVLFIGLGSIGQRHLRNLYKLYGNELTIIAYRVRGFQMTFSETMQIRKNIDLEKEYNIKSFTNLEKALAEKPDIAFISNVTRAHIPCAIAAAKASCDIFLEKPISDNMDGVAELKQIVEEKNLKVFVGFQNRYHPAIQMTKKL